ncbi:MAG: cytochrome c biogenesis protein CcdA [Candidatus Omnitrophota bacterium]
MENGFNIVEFIQTSINTQTASLSANPFALIWVFFAGIAIAFTPCVYPLLPITVAYIGANSGHSRWKGFTLSLIYVSGMSLTYAALGIGAVITGSIFGRFSSLAIVRIIVGIIIASFGFTLWKGKTISLPSPNIPMIKKSNIYISTFFLGFTSALVISPCTAPVLGSILLFVSTTKSYFYGFSLLFSFSCGMGFLLILTGSFSSILTSLPKSGHWMMLIQKFCAGILIVFGIYLVFSATISLTYSR